MIELTTRENRRAAQRPVPVPVAALTTSGWAAIVSSAPVVAVALIAWVAESRSGAPAYDAVRIGYNGWLLAHGTRLHTDAGSLGLAPLALSILVFRQLMRAGANSARATGAGSLPDAARIIGWIAFVYGTLGAIVAFLAGTSAVNASLIVAGGATGAVAAIASAVGVLRVNGIGAQLTDRLPAPLIRALPVGVLAACVLLGTGALLAGTCLALAADSATGFFTAYEPGLVGSAALTALAVLYTPTAAIWGTAYVIGPGFAVGSGTSVSAIDVSIGLVPAFPLFAALPSERASDLVSLLLGVPLVAGLLAGVAAARRRADGERWASTLLTAALSGPVAGAIIGLAAFIAGGPLGDGRLAAVGPSPWRVALVAGVEVTLFAVVGAALVRIMASYKPVHAEPEPDESPVEAVADDHADQDVDGDVPEVTEKEDL